MTPGARGSGAASGPGFHRPGNIPGGSPQAGGLVEAVEPGADPLEAGTILAANEPIFDTFAKVIRNV